MKILSNQIYDNYLYNKEIKDRFINIVTKNSSENTVVAYKRILSRVSILEKRYEKDLFDFTTQEVEQFLIKLNPTSLNSAIQSISLIDNYIKWALGEHLSKGSMNPLDIFTTAEFAERVVNKRVKNIFTYDEINEVIVDTVNFQDSALVLSLFFGIMGKQFSEISNLRIQDIGKEQNIINLKGLESERSIKLETEEQLELIDLLEMAHEQNEYIKNNGVANKIKNPRMPLVRNDYVFRPMSRVRTTGDHPTTASYFVLRNRIVTLSEAFDKPSFTAINIRNSGMLYMAYQEYKNNGEELTKASRRKIYEFYNMQKSKNRDDFYSHIYEREFLNVETIRELYY